MGQWVRMVEKPIVVGLTAAALDSLMGDGSNIRLFGQSWSEPVAFGVAAGLGQVAGEYFGQIVRGKNLLGKKYGSLAEAAVLSGAATLAVFYLFSAAKPADNMAALKVAGLGAASTVAGTYVDDKFIRPMMRKSA